MRRNADFVKILDHHHATLSCATKYKDCADEWKRAVRYDEMFAEEHVVTANNVGAFYIYVYKRTTNHCGVGVVTDKIGLPITNDQAKANAFNDYFSSVGTADNADNDVMPCCHDVTFSFIRTVKLTDLSDYLRCF